MQQPPTDALRRLRLARLAGPEASTALEGLSGAWGASPDGSVVVGPVFAGALDDGC